MKKNAMLKIAAVLLVAVLLTTCAISSTFAKYVTEGKSYDSGKSRVARWGVTAETELSGTLFAKSYSSANGSVQSLYDEDEDGEIDLVFAPGTSGTVSMDTELGGTPEVSGIVDYTGTCEAASDDLENLLTVLNLKVNNVAVTYANVTAAGGLGQYLNEQINAMDYRFTPGTDLDGTTKTLTISWDWQYEVSDTQDSIDTELSKKDHMIKVAFEVAIYQTGAAGAAPVAP